MNTVLFACVHNAGRSQMAAAWLNLLADPAKARAISAGTDPGPRVHRDVVAVMNEVGVDLSNVSTTRLTEDLARRSQMLITMGCGDQCPVVPGISRADWPLEDPKGKPIERVREIRDEIRQRVQALLDHEQWSRASQGETMAHLPIACTLTPDALRARQQGLLAGLLRRAEGRDLTAEGLRLRFAAADDTLSTIARAVDAERQCCRFLRFAITVEPDGGPMFLEVTGPPGTREFVAGLLEL
jgi:arsenate reductase